MDFSGVPELWETLGKCGKILLYGTGNCADKILDELFRRGIAVDGVFVSDGFVRNREFRGFPVMSPNAAEKRFGDFTALLAFGSSRPEVLENVEKISARHMVFAPDVPLCGTEIFDRNFFELHKSEIEYARSLFCDGLSAKTFDGIIKFKLSGELAYLYDCQCDEKTADSVLSGGYTAYIDLGAYNGDTVKTALSDFPTIEKAAAMEPAKKPFEKLSSYCESVENVKFSLFCAAASDENRESEFSDGGGRGSSLAGGPSKSGAKNRLVRCAPPDDIIPFSGEKLLIKYDVEGAEAAALKGSAHLMKNSDTDLAVSLYHRSSDIFALPALVRKLLPNHRLYLRKLIGFPAWDIKLYACIK